MDGGACEDGPVTRGSVIAQMTGLLLVVGLTGAAVFTAPDAGARPDTPLAVLAQPAPEPVQAPSATAAVPAASGPSPVGRPEPEQRQRLIDNLVWLLLLATVLGMVVGLVIGWWRRRPDRPADDAANVA